MRELAEGIGYGDVSEHVRCGQEAHAAGERLQAAYDELLDEHNALLRALAAHARAA